MKPKRGSIISPRRFVTSPMLCALMLTRPQVLPIVLKSAVQSANAAVFVPSSFDFISVHNYFKKHAGVTFTVLSEYGLVNSWSPFYSNSVA